MKSFVYRILSIAACFVTALAFQGCVDNLEEAQRNLSASPSEFNNVSGTGETLTINVESNLYWNVSAQDADGNTVRWIEFDKTQTDDTGEAETPSGGGEEENPYG